MYVVLLTALQQSIHGTIKTLTRLYCCCYSLLSHLLAVDFLRAGAVSSSPLLSNTQGSEGHSVGIINAY